MFTVSQLDLLSGAKNQEVVAKTYGYDTTLGNFVGDITDNMINTTGGLLTNTSGFVNNLLETST